MSNSKDKSFRIIEPEQKKPFEKFAPPKPEPEPQAAPPHKETMVETAAAELQVKLPGVNLPLLLKLIALFTLVGGLSIIGSASADIFNPQKVGFLTYILRLAAGVVFVIISYGIVKRQNWATWLYGAMVIMALFINWPLAILPALIVIYMIFNRKYFFPSIFDKLFNKASTALSTRFK